VKKVRINFAKLVAALSYTRCYSLNLVGVAAINIDFVRSMHYQLPHNRSGKIRQHHTPAEYSASIPSSLPRWCRP